MPVRYSYRPKTEQGRLESTLSWNIDGLVLTRHSHTPHALKTIEVAGVLVAGLIDSQSPCLNTAVGLDNFGTARRMTTTVITHGRRHVAYLGVRLDEYTVIRQKDYEQAVCDANLVPYGVTAERSSSYSFGIELIRRARREYPQLDGILCTNDDLAVEAAFEYQRLGLKTPDNMATARSHGHDTRQAMEPRPASVLTPHEWMGSTGTEHLLARIRSEAATPRMSDLGFTSSPGGFI